MKLCPCCLPHQHGRFQLQRMVVSPLEPLFLLPRSGELSGNEISGALKVGESLLQNASIYHCRSFLQVLTVEVGDYAYVLAKDGKVAAASAVFLGCRTFLGAFPEPWSTGHDDTSCAKVHVELATFSAVDVFDVNGGSDAPRPAVMAGGRIIIRRTGTSAGVATFDRICQDRTVQRA